MKSDLENDNVEYSQITEKQYTKNIDALKACYLALQILYISKYKDNMPLFKIDEIL